MTTPSAMDAERRERVEELFEAALEVPRAERSAWLLKACRGDDALRAEVASLLDAHERADGILEADVLAGAESLLPRRPRDEGWFGPYRILRELGRGGMGVVYLAERDDGHFRRRLALKVLRAGPDEHEVHKRFLAERQILAALDHPGIARLLDGGVTPDGRPFLAMEFVAGIPITEYCDRHRLGVAERLRLFQAVCAAVHHAHQNLVVHRDLKPGNILVTDAGDVKLLDFGIAKLLNPTFGPADAPVTRTEHRVMTPEYASPEQVRGDLVTTASDVYALGVVLYELLTGHRPYRLTRRTTAEILELVCERDPERPSTRVTRPETVVREDGSRTEVGPEQVGAARGVPAERLRRRLRGDLDDIVLMAMRKEPRRRYGSAELLSQDIQSYLDGLPVRAHRESGWYRAGKFVRRNRVETIAATLILFSLLGGVGVASREARIASRERDRASEALARAEDALAQSEAVTGFLIGLFEATDPEAAQGDLVNTREFLERGLARAEELSPQPAVQARMLEAMGRVHAGLGEYARGQDLLERALAVRKLHYGPRHPEVATNLVHLGIVYRQRGRYEEAVRAQEEALSIRQEALGPGHPVVAESLDELASMAIYQANVPRADSLYRASLALRRAAFGNEHPKVAGSIILLASTVRRLGRASEAETLFREALSLQERIYGANDPVIATTRFHLADLVMDFKGDFVEAERLLNQGLAAVERAYGPRHTLLIHGINSLANLKERTGHPDEAEALYRRTLAIVTAVRGSGHPGVAASKAAIADLLRRNARLSDAEALALEALEAQQQTFGAGHFGTGATVSLLGRIRLDQGRLEEAERYFAEALEIHRRALVPTHFLLARVKVDLARVYTRQGRYAEAETLLDEAMDVARDQFPADYPDLRIFYESLSELYRATDRPEEAQRYRRLADDVAGRR